MLDILSFFIGTFLNSIFKMNTKWILFSFISIFHFQVLKASPGLYDSKDNVTILHGDNVIPTLRNSSSLWLLEYYVEWCGHCQQFAPMYKALAKDVAGWRWVIKIGSIDCGATAPSGDENFLTCHQHPFWVFDYPEFRFHAAHANSSDMGEVFQVKEDIKHLRSGIVDFIEKHIATIDWNYDTPRPNLQAIEYKRIINDIPPNNMPDDVFYIALIFEDHKSMMGREMILDMSSCSNIILRRVVVDTDDGKALMKKFNVQEEAPPFVLVVPRNGTIFPIKVAMKTRYFYVYQLKRLPGVGEEKASIIVLPDDFDARELQPVVDYKTVERNQVYLADIESGIRYMLTMEASAAKALTGTKLEALKKTVKLFADVGQYLPGRKTTQNFMFELNKWIQPMTSITTEKWLHRVAEIQTDNFLPPTRKLWVGCQASVPSLRGYPCSLWTIFHTLSVAAYKAQIDAKLLPDVMHGYITNFFGCRECRNNFKDEVKDMPFVPTNNPYSAIVWLWKMHNKVNERLHASSPRNDPAFPKVPFPPDEFCPRCRDSTGSWVETEVAAYLIHRFSSEHISTEYLEFDASEVQNLTLGEHNATFLQSMLNHTEEVGVVLEPVENKVILPEISDILANHVNADLTDRNIESSLNNNNSENNDSSKLVPKVDVRTLDFNIHGDDVNDENKNISSQTEVFHSVVISLNVTTDNGVIKVENSQSTHFDNDSAIKGNLKVISEIVDDFKPLVMPDKLDKRSIDSNVPNKSPLSDTAMPESKKVYLQIPHPPVHNENEIIEDVAKDQHKEKDLDKEDVHKDLQSIMDLEKKDDISDILKDAVIIEEKAVVEVKDDAKQNKVVDDEVWRKRLENAFHHVPKQNVPPHPIEDAQAIKPAEESRFHPRGLGYNNKRYPQNDSKSRVGMGFSSIDFNLCLVVWLASACMAILLIITLQAKRGWFRRFKLSKHIL